MNEGMVAALHEWPVSERTVWVVGQSDDLIDAVFDTSEAAGAYLQARGGEQQFWWVTEVPFNPPEEAA